jgi:hypothetical protein
MAPQAHAVQTASDDTRYYHCSYSVSGDKYWTAVATKLPYEGLTQQWKAYVKGKDGASAYCFSRYRKDDSPYQSLDEVEAIGRMSAGAKRVDWSPKHAAATPPAKPAVATSAAKDAETARAAKKAERDAEFAAKQAKFEEGLAAQQKAVAEYEAAQRRMEADRVAAAAKAQAAQAEFARKEAAHQAELERYAQERAKYEAAVAAQPPR